MSAQSPTSSKHISMPISNQDIFTELKISVNKGKWTEKDFTIFMRLTSMLKNLSDLEIEQLYNLVIQTPQAHLPRVLFGMINQRFLEFIQKGKSNNFIFLSTFNEEIQDLILRSIGIENDLDLFLGDTELNTKRFTEKVEEILEIKSDQKNDDQKISYKSLKRIDKVRLIYTLILLKAGLSESKIQQIYNYVLLLIHFFIRDVSSPEPKLPISAVSEFKKLIIYFRALKDNTSEETINNLYQIEEIERSQIENLRSINQILEQNKQSNKEQIARLISQLDEAKIKIDVFQKNEIKQQEELKNLQKQYDELEASYLRFRETSEIETKNQFNSFLIRLERELSHEFTKLQRGIDKHIQDEKSKYQLALLDSW